MANIENIPQEMVMEHVRWHTLPGNPASGGRAINPWPPTGGGPTPGSGEEFLVWHEGYLRRFSDWYAAQNPGDVPPLFAIQPWKNIPIHLKMGMNGWNAKLAGDEARARVPSNFGSLDELGRFLEWRLHAFLHVATAGMHREMVLQSFESPRSTFFWQIHGLIDKWRADWVAWNEREIDPRVPTESVSVLSLPLGQRISVGIGLPGEVDRFMFTVKDAGAYVMETHGPTNTVLYLTGPDDPQRSIDSNDDGGEGSNARLVRQLGIGVYHLYVLHYSSEAVGDYEISTTMT